MTVDEVDGAGGRLSGQESRANAAEAAARGEAWACVEAIIRGPLFDGLTRRLLRFEHVDGDLAYDLFASALDQVHAQVSQGAQIRDPIAWVRRVALNQASDTEAERRREVEYKAELDYRHPESAASCPTYGRLRTL